MSAAEELEEATAADYRRAFGPPRLVALDGGWTGVVADELEAQGPVAPSVEERLRQVEAQLHALQAKVLALHQAKGAPSDRLLGVSEVEGMTGLHRSTLWRRYRAGTFPAPEYVGDHRKWAEAAVVAWLAEQASAPRRTNLGRLASPGRGGVR